MTVNEISNQNTMVKPKTLKPGDPVAIIAPSSPVDKDKLALSVESIKFLGLKPILYPCCTQKHGYLSGVDKERARNMNAAFADPCIKGIFCIRGGYGAARILPLLDYDLIRANPKLFLGYSDITALHTAFNKFCNLVTFHAPMPTTGYANMDSYSYQSLAANIFTDQPVGEVSQPEGQSLSTLNPGSAEGMLTGGNLSLLASTLGSKYEVDTRGKLLFLEDTSERPYRIDKNLTALALAGKFEDCAGIILGTWSGCTEAVASDTPDQEAIKGLSLNQIFEEVVKPFNKPTVLNFRAGHTYPQATIPMGIRARLDATNAVVTYLEAGTEQ